MENMIKQETINFRDLVSKDKNISLSIQSKMVDRLNKVFNEEEHRWYVANLYMYMSFHPTNDYPINLEDIFGLLGFAHKKNAMRTLENNFTENEDYKVTVLPRERGKFNKEIVILNVETFKNLCMISKTEKGKMIRKYYIKLETNYNEIVKSEFEELKLKFENQQKLLVDKDLQIIEIKKVSMLHKQNLILKQYEFESVLYIIIVKTLEGVYIIKIGYSEGNFTRRWNDHNKKYPECILLDVFPVKMAHKFETFVHRELKHWRYKLLPGFEKEKELFQIGKGIQYDDVLNIINKNIKRFNDPNIIIKELELENQRLKTKLLTFGYDCETEENIEIINEKVNIKEVVKEADEENCEEAVEEAIEVVEEEAEEESEEEVVDENVKTLDEINEIKRRKKNSERQKKYRQSEKYKQKIQTPEFIAKERERNNIRTKSDKFKQTSKEYYQNNKALINEKNKKYKKESKKEKVSTISEKEKYLNWCKEHIVLQNDTNLIFKNFIGNYIETSKMILSIYKEYTQEFIKNEFPTIEHTLKRYKINKESFYGWKGLCYK